MFPKPYQHDVDKGLGGYPVASLDISEPFDRRAPARALKDFPKGRSLPGTWEAWLRVGSRRSGRVLTPGYVPGASGFREGLPVGEFPACYRFLGSFSGITVSTVKCYVCTLATRTGQE